jgi:hypothetical protein
VTREWVLQIDRVIVTGVTGKLPDSGQLQTLIQSAVANAVAGAPTPPGRAVQASVRVRAPTLNSGQAIAQAVASGVSQGLKGRSHG